MGCSRPESDAQSPDSPNVLLVVFDTVRKDHLSVYGYSEPTTPFIKQWAEGGRVFTNCISTAPHTVPSHASMFTGLLPTEHGIKERGDALAGAHTTLAEALRSAGYQTYLFSANPHVSALSNLDQGFDRVEHPWDERHREAALEIVRRKFPTTDRTCREVRNRVQGGRAQPWDFKAAGELNGEALMRWLATRDKGKPWFAVLNYMEAHAPYVPEEKYRKRFMSDADVKQSYRIDRSWTSQWSYNVGLHEYYKDEIRITRATYDATLAELDDHFKDLIQGLDRMGQLDDTFVILTADHGEHLGDHHLIGHEYSLYQPALQVPLILHYPPRVPAGTDEQPAMAFDVFPTIIELTGLSSIDPQYYRSQNLLTLSKQRLRLAEYRAHFEDGLRVVLRSNPDWDPTPWRRSLRALFAGHYKLIWASDGKHELYNIKEDPGEQYNLFGQTMRTESLVKQYEEYVSELVPRHVAPSDTRSMSPGDLERLAALGYVDLGTNGDETESQGAPSD